MRQAIIWGDYDLLYWHMSTQLELNELHYYPMVLDDDEYM